jgi:hypothetical protein
MPPRVIQPAMSAEEKKIVADVAEMLVARWDTIYEVFFVPIDDFGFFEIIMALKIRPTWKYA